MKMKITLIALTIHSLISVEYDRNGVLMVRLECCLYKTKCLSPKNILSSWEAGFT